MKTTEQPDLEKRVQGLSIAIQYLIVVLVFVVAAVVFLGVNAISTSRRIPTVSAQVSTAVEISRLNTRTQLLASAAIKMSQQLSQIQQPPQGQCVPGQNWRPPAFAVGTMNRSTCELYGGLWYP